MAKRLKLENHLSVRELKAKYLSSRDPKEARRWQALWLIAQGKSVNEVAEVVGLQGCWIRRVIHRYNQQGVNAVRDGHEKNPGGGKPLLNAEQQEKLLKALQEEPADGGLWTGVKVARWIQDETGHKTYPQRGWVYLTELGLSLKVPRRKHARSATKQEQEKFKKKLSGKHKESRKSIQRQR